MFCMWKRVSCTVTAPEALQILRDVMDFARRSARTTIATGSSDYWRHLEQFKEYKKRYLVTLDSGVLEKVRADLVAQASAHEPEPILSTLCDAADEVLRAYTTRTPTGSPRGRQPTFLGSPGSAGTPFSSPVRGDLPPVSPVSPATPQTPPLGAAAAAAARGSVSRQLF